jgi:putative FmdB family regulatory protein
MPLYEYVCQECDHRFEQLQLRHDPEGCLKPQAPCPKCSGVGDRVISSCGFRLYLCNQAPRRVSVYSDGSPWGSRVVDSETGLELDSVTRVVITIDAHEPRATCQLHLLNPGNIQCEDIEVAGTAELAALRAENERLRNLLWGAVRGHSKECVRCCEIYNQEGFKALDQGGQNEEA